MSTIKRRVPANVAPYLDAAVNNATVLDAALTYAAAGMYVVPIRPGTKNPGSLLGKGWHQHSSRDRDVIASWFQRWPDAGVAIHTGRSGLVVFDLDRDDFSGMPSAIVEELEQLPFQRSRGQGSRGHYFALTSEPLGNSAGGFAPYGDVRGTNGVVLAAPTTHPTTQKPYRIVRDGLIPALSPVLRSLLSTRASVASVAAPVLDGPGFEAFLSTHVDESSPGRIAAPLGDFDARVLAGESRHASLVAALAWAFRDVQAGYYSARRAVDEFHAAFTASFTMTRPGQRSEPNSGEFEDAVKWAAAQPPAKEVANRLWTLSDELRRIQRWAREKYITPWSLLGVGLVRAITAIPPQWAIPPIIGGPASCNFFLGIVGESGSGKGLAINTGPTVFEFQEPAATDVYPGKPATGEGIAKMFGSFDPKTKEVEYRCTRVSLLVTEIDFLDAMFKRDSASLSPILRELFSGEPLGADYSIKENRVIVRALRYRATFAVCIQPDHGAAIFADMTGGLPQRFVFVSTQDPEILEPTGDTSDLVPIRLPTWPTETTDVWLTRMGQDVKNDELHAFTVPHFVRELVLQARRDKMRAKSGGLDGHRLLLQMKVALAFAVLHGRTDGFEEAHWEMAELFMKHSDATRQDVLAATANAARHHRDAKARADGRAQIVRSEAADAERRGSCRRRLRDLISTEWVSRSMVARRVSDSQREVLNEVLAELIETGELQRRHVRSGSTQGFAYRRAAAP